MPGSGDGPSGRPSVDQIQAPRIPSPHQFQIRNESVRVGLRILNEWLRGESDATFPFLQGKEEGRPIRMDWVALLRVVGLGRLELPTSRLSGERPRPPIPASCRLFPPYAARCRDSGGARSWSAGVSRHLVDTYHQPCHPGEFSTRCEESAPARLPAAACGKLGGSGVQRHAFSQDVAQRPRAPRDLHPTPADEPPSRAVLRSGSP